MLQIGRTSSPLDLRAQLRPIVLLAVGLVLATMGLSPKKLAHGLGRSSEA